MTARFQVARRQRSWSTLVAGVVLGGLFCVAEVAGGLGLPQAVLSWAIIAGYALLVTTLQGRSETAAVLTGRPVDERWAAIHVHAMAFSAQIGVGVALIAYLVAEFRHVDSQPFGAMAAALGIAYLAGILLYRWRT